MSFLIALTSDGEFLFDRTIISFRPNRLVVEI